MTQAVPRHRTATGQFLRFVAVGVANTATAWLIILWLQQPLGLLAASGIGYATALVQSFLINRGWTFAAGGDWRVQVPRFIAVNLVCGALFSALNAWAAPVIGLLPATITGVALTTPLSFMLNRWLVFR